MRGRAELVTQIDESTRNMLRQEILNGLASGAMCQDIIDSVMDGDIFSDARATLIADTELGWRAGRVRRPDTRKRRPPASN